MQHFNEYGPLALLLKASWQAGVIILLVLALQRALGRRLGPRWRYGLWLLVVVRLALPWTIPSGVSLFNFLNFSSGSEAVVSPQSTPPVTHDLQPAVSIPAQLPAQEAQSPSEAVAAFRPHLSWLATVWAAGALALALGLAITHYRISRRVAQCRPLIDSPVLNLLEDCKQRMGVRAPVALLETAAVDGPCLFGFLRPRLLLPPGFTRCFSLEELRFVFLHELAHLKRHDIFLGWLTAALQILHWFNPLVWLAFTRMRVDRELACDALALSYAKEQDHKPYGRTIVKLLENFGDSVRAPSLAGIVEDKEQMKERILMIAQFNKSKGGFAVAACLLAGLAVATLTDAQTGDKSAEQQHLKLARAGDKWAAYWLWDSYYGGKNGIKADPANADKWLRELVQNVWVVKFEPVKDFSPTSPQEFLERIDQYAQSYSGKTDFGAASFFRTTKRGDKLVGSFLSNYPDQLKASLAKVPGLKIASVEQITPEGFIPYEESSQESLGTSETESNKWDERQQIRMAEGGNKWAAYGLWDSYYRGKNGVKPNRAKADKWLREFVQNVWVVKFEPVDDFAPTNPQKFLERIDQFAHSFSGKTEIGAASFFRTTKRGDKLAGSFLSNYPEQLKASLVKVPGVKVTSVEQITPEKFIEYEQSPQESL